MPTILPERRVPPPPTSDRGGAAVRDIMIAATLLLSVLVLVCERSFGPTPGYSLAASHHDLQLSP